MKDSRGIEVSAETSLHGAIAVLDRHAMQIVLVVDEQRRLLGTVCDGDIRRGILAGLDLTQPVDRVMNQQPRTVTEAVDREGCLDVMKRQHVAQLPVLDAHARVMGIELLDDLLQSQPLPNDVVLFAGGRGKRLRPLTDKLPKPLLEVGQQSLLERTIKDLVQQGLANIWIAVHYKAEMIEDQIGDGSRFGARIRYLTEESPLGTAGGLGLLPQRPEHPILVRNADVLSSLDARDLLNFHASLERDSSDRDYEATICLRSYETQVPYGVVHTNGLAFEGIEEKPVVRFFVNAGIYVLEPSVLNLVPRDHYLDMPDLLNMLHEEGRKIAVFPMREDWSDIGSPEDFAQASQSITDRSPTSRSPDKQSPDKQSSVDRTNSEKDR